MEIKVGDHVYVPVLNKGDSYRWMPGELYRVYSAWAKDSNEYLMSATKFGREIGKKFEKKTIHGVVMYQNVTLKDAYRPYNMKIGVM